MKKKIALFLVFTIVLSNTLIFASNKPSFETLVQEYEKKVDTFFFSASIVENIGLKGNLESIATSAFSEYQRVTPPDSKSQYTYSDFVNQLEFFARLGFEVGAGKFKLAARAAALAYHVKNQHEMNSAEKELIRAYPDEAKRYLNIDTGGGGSGGGGSSRTW